MDNVWGSDNALNLTESILDKFNLNEVNYVPKAEMVLENLVDKAYGYYIEKRQMENHGDDYLGLPRHLYGPKLFTRNDYFNVYEVFYKTLGITNVQPFVVYNRLDVVYAYLTYILGNTKKANKTMVRLAKFSQLEDFSQNMFISEYTDLTMNMEELIKYLKYNLGDDPTLTKENGLMYIFETVKNHSIGENINAYELMKEMRREPATYENYRRYSVYDHERFSAIGNARLVRLVTDMEYKYLIELLDLMIARNDIDLHDFLENLTNGFYERLKDDPKYQDRIVKFIRRLKGVNREDFLQIIQFINYKRIYRARNVDIMRNNIEYIMEARNNRAYNNAGSGTVKRVSEPYMLFDDSIHIRDFKNQPLRDDVVFTKDINEINTIGSRTLCCFTPNGLAKSLVKVSAQSPLSGILEGKVINSGGGRSGTWFSFVWEMMDRDENGLFRSSLILDNIESSTQIPYETFVDYVKKVYDNSAYNQIWMGNSRNDISGVPSELYNSNKLINRPRTLINYENSFASYSYDDSRQLYNVSEILNLDPSPKIENINIKRVDTGWFERVQSVEKMFWGENRDGDLFNININASPSYVITGDDDVILGYLITRLIKVIEDTDDETGEIIYRPSYKYLTSKKDIGSVFREDDEEFALLFEDIYLSDNRKVIGSLSHIIDDIKLYVEKNNIRFTSASANVSSKSFIKRLEKHSTFIEDTRFGDNPEDRPVGSNNTGFKVKNDVFAKNVKINNLIERENMIDLDDFRPKESEEIESTENDFSYSYD